MKFAFWRFYLIVLVSMIILAMGIEGVLHRQDETLDSLIPAKVLFCAKQIAVDCDPGARWQTLDETQIALPAATATALNSQKVVALRVDDNHASLLIKDQHQQFHLYGPVRMPPESDSRAWSLYLLFFGALGLLLLYWLWPIFRDLNHIETSLKSSGKALDLRFNLPAHSTAAPVAMAIERLSQQVLQLLSSQRDMTHFIAHDLRTPLARMRFALAMLKNDQPDLRQDLFDNIVEMERIATEYLRYAEEEAHHSVLALEPLNTDSFFTDLHLKTGSAPVMADRDHQSIENGIAISLSLSAKDFFADRFSLERAVSNLLQNALRFARSQICISLQTGHGVCILRVDDDGPGVPKGARHRFGTAFSQANKDSPHAVRSERERGFGLGLYIVLRVAMLHRGHMKILSSPRLGGARFELVWPNRP